MPATKASLDTVGKIGKYTANLGIDAIKSLIGAADIYGMSEMYKQTQDMYKTYSAIETKDRTDRINAENEAESKGLFGKLFGKMKNCAENAKAQSKLEKMAWEITRAGQFSTPLQAYAIKNGDVKTYMKLVPRTKNEKPFVDFGAGLRFDSAKDFANWYGGISEAMRQMQWAKDAKEFYQTQAGNSQTETKENTRQERNINEEIEVSRSPWAKEKKVRGLLSA